MHTPKRKRLFEGQADALAERWIHATLIINGMYKRYSKGVVDSVIANAIQKRETIVGALTENRFDYPAWLESIELEPNEIPRAEKLLQLDDHPPGQTSKENNFGVINFDA